MSPAHQARDQSLALLVCHTRYLMMIMMMWRLCGVVVKTSEDVVITNIVECASMSKCQNKMKVKS